MEGKTCQNGRHLIGEVWVDSGQVMLVDPCYLHEWGGNDYGDTDKATFDYSGVCAVTLGKAEGQEGEQAGQVAHGAVVTSSGWGDGSYPVYVNVEQHRVKSLTIVFFDDDDFDD